MKANLVIKLVEAHFQGGDVFVKAVQDLAADEEKKGNGDIASKLRATVAGRKGASHPIPVTPQVAEGSALFNVSGVVTPPARPIPKDKDSALDLYQVEWPSETLDSLILSPKLRELFDQIIQEHATAERLIRSGLKPVHKVLLSGPPGCGKTTAARALAHAMGLPIAVVRLDSLVSSYLGQTSTNLRRIFDAVAGQPIVLLLDEFDAIAKRRDDAQEVGELKRIVISLLQNFDTLNPNVILIAATNHPHLLDPAVWRRFDLNVSMDLPDEGQRKVFLEAWLNRYPVEDRFDWKVVASALEGLSGSQIKDIVSFSAKKALFGDHEVTTKDMLSSIIDFYTRFGDDEGPLPVALALQERGIPIRTIAEIVGRPHSTLDHQLKKLKKNKEASSAE